LRSYNGSFTIRIHNSDFFKISNTESTHWADVSDFIIPFIEVLKDNYYINADITKYSSSDTNRKSIGIDKLDSSYFVFDVIYIEGKLKNKI